LATEGSVYRRKSDGRWVAQYRDANDKVRYLYRKTKAEAKKALREALQDRDDGHVPADKLTVEKYLEDWMGERRNAVSARTWRTQESLLRNTVIVHLGDKRLSNLSPDDIRELYRRQLRDGLSPTTIGFIRTLLKGSMRDTVRTKYIRTNPLDDVTPPKQARNEKEILSPEELKLLLDTVRGSRYEGVFYLCSLVGLRIGECLALKYDDIDLERGTVRIERTLHEGQCYPTKTPSSRRVLTLPQMAVECLIRHRERQPNPAGYIFATSTGRPISATSFYERFWRPALRECSLPTTLTPHCLRHGTASLLLNQNVPIPVVSKYLGHSNPQVTMRTYAHMIDGTSGMAADGIDAALD
jgi:integrase